MKGRKMLSTPIGSLAKLSDSGRITRSNFNNSTIANCAMTSDSPLRWTARLLDATRLVATLNEERELPVVFAECRKLILSLR